MLTVKSIFTITAVATISIASVADSADIFEYFTFSDATLPEANALQIGGYDEQTNAIWMLGGSCGDCVHLYNISTDTITALTDIPTSISNNNPDNSVIVNSTIYYITTDGIFGKYNILSDTQTHPWINNPDSLYLSCLVSNIENTMLFTIDSTNEFYIINITNESIIQGPNSNYDRFSPSCSVTSDNYMYVMFGGEPRIERISLNGDILRYVIILCIRLN